MSSGVEISVVLPSYNGKQYIRDSIESVIGQSFKDWELIIVNDGSTDGTADIIKEYAEKDKRIHSINNKTNKGLPKALNDGFDHSNGRYLTWCSDDNYYLPEALKKMYEYLLNNTDKPMVCSACYLLESGKEERSIIQYNPDSIYIANSVGACFLYRREVLDSIGQYDERLFLVEDFEYWLRILEFCGEIGFIPEPLLVYRRQKNSLTLTRFEEIQKKRVALLWHKRRWIFDHIKDNGLVCALYYLDMKQYGYMDEEYGKKCCNIYPPLKRIKEADPQKKYIIYGAGKYGAAALEKLQGQVVCFSDSNPLRWGTLYNGLQVISPEEVVRCKDNYNIVIAVKRETAIVIMEFLYQNHVEGYSLYNPAQKE